MITPEQVQNFAATWYRALDVHAPIQECFAMLADDGLHMHFPDADIQDLASFGSWYRQVTNLFFDENHAICEVAIESSRNDEADAKVIVDWQAAWWQPPAAASNRVHLRSTQTWTVRRSLVPKNGFGLEIVKYRAPAKGFNFAPRSAELPPTPSDEVRELITLNQRIGEAERTKDEQFLKSVLSENLRFRRANGTIVDKAIYIVDLMKPENTTDDLHSDDIVPRIHGNVAVVELSVKVKGMRGGKKLDCAFRNIRIFLREPAKQPQWQLHSWFNVAPSETSNHRE